MTSEEKTPAGNVTMFPDGAGNSTSFRAIYQTGWTGLVSKMLQQSGERKRQGAERSGVAFAD
jgi:hypothetical protein